MGLWKPKEVAGGNRAAHSWQGSSQRGRRGLERGLRVSGPLPNEIHDGVLVFGGHRQCQDLDLSLGTKGAKTSILRAHHHWTGRDRGVLLTQGTRAGYTVYFLRHCLERNCRQERGLETLDLTTRLLGPNPTSTTRSRTRRNVPSLSGSLFPICQTGTLDLNWGCKLVALRFNLQKLFCLA